MSENDKKATVGQTSDPVQQPHTIDEIVPRNTPLIIPYFEAYRTNELEYVEYQSPYLNQNETSGDSSEEDDGSDTSEENSGSSDRARSSKLWTDISKLVWEYYPKLKKKDDFIRDLKSCEVNWTSIAKQVNKRGNPHNKKKQSDFIEAVLKLLEQYHRIDRKTYSSTKQLVIAGGKIINASPKAQKVVKNMQKAKYWNPTTRRYEDDSLTQKTGNILNAITTISKKESKKSKSH